MSVSIARYTKVGRKATVMAKVSFPDSGSSAIAAGDFLQHDGLPFSIGGSGTDERWGTIYATSLNITGGTSSVDNYIEENLEAINEVHRLYLHSIGINFNFEYDLLKKEHVREKYSYQMFNTNDKNNKDNMSN